MFNASKEVSVVGNAWSVDFVGVATSAVAVFLILDGASYASRGAAVASLSGEMRLRFDGGIDDPSSRSGEEEEEEESTWYWMLEELLATSLPGAIAVQKFFADFEVAGLLDVLPPRYVILNILFWWPRLSIIAPEIEVGRLRKGQALDIEQSYSR